MTQLVEDKKQATPVRSQEFEQIMKMLRTVLPSLKDVDDETLMTAIAYAKHLGLDPLKKEVHLIPYKSKDGVTIQPVVSYTEYIKRAERSGKLKGWTCRVQKQGNEYVAIVEIKRSDWDIPFVWEVPMAEARRDTPLWKQQPLFMLRKTAIAQAFRMCFPEETAHLPYEESEFWEEPIPVEPVKTNDTEQTQSEYISDAQRKRFWAIVKKELGYNEEFVKEVLKERYGIESTAQIRKDQYEEIIEYFRQLSKPVE